ncbi:MAG TPA: hypothetical protein VND45_17030, partial [Thermoanaerobaculia bacterium]|nr:hypothetical protein [Thermoanaerobaculia bacterium]
MHKVPFARLAMLLVLVLGAFANSYAQGACEAPGEFDFGVQVCPNGQGWAVSRYGPPPSYAWDTYQWTVTGGTITSDPNGSSLSYIAGPGGTVEITLTVSGNGCSGTKTHTAIVTPQRDALIESDSRVCPTGRSTASVMYPAANYSWSITNGTFVRPPNGWNVEFIAGESGVVTLDVVATDSTEGCEATGHLEIPIVGPATSILTDSVVCPTSLAWASLMADGMFAGGTYWWTAQNAHIVGSATSPSIQFMPDGTGPVTLSVTGSAGSGCSLSATQTIPVQPQIVPQLSANAETVCPSGQVTFNIANWSELASYRWEIVGATPVGNVVGGIAVTPSSGSTSVKVTASGMSAGGCETSASATVPVATPDATVWAPASVCPNSTFTASVADAGEGATYSWVAGGDGLLLSTNGREATFRINSGPMQARVTVASATGCSIPGEAVVSSGAALTPAIRAELPSCSSAGTASVDNAANYASVQWTIANGAFDGPSSGPSVNFHATSTAAVTLTANVSDGGSCSGSASVQVSQQTPTLPVITTTATRFCATGQRATAQVANSGSFRGIDWTLTNAVIVNRSPADNSIEYRSIAEGPVALSVSATDANGCPVSATMSVPYQPLQVPVISAPAEHCGVGSQFNVELTNADLFEQGTITSFNWAVRNGYVVGSYGRYATIQVTSSTNPVEIMVEVANYECRSTATATVAPRSGAVTPPPITFPLAEICPTSSMSASVPDGYMNYNWTIQNGSIYSGGGSTIWFTANGNGPVKLSVTMQSTTGCPVTSTATVPLKVTAPPVISFEKPNVCPNGPGTAWTDGYHASYVWSIVNGTFSSPTSSNFVSYTANGNGPVQLTVRVSEYDGCSATATNAQPLREALPPVITFEKPTVCPNGPGTAWTDGSWAGYTWSIVNGTFTSPTSSNFVTYMANGNGPVELTVHTWTSEFCNASAKNSQPLRETLPPVITFEKPNVCPNGPGVAWTDGSWAGYTWSIVNG